MQVDFQSPETVTRMAEVVEEKTAGTVTQVAVDLTNGKAHISIDVGEMQPLRKSLELMNRPENLDDPKEPQLKPEYELLMAQFVVLLNDAGCIVRS